MEYLSDIKTKFVQDRIRETSWFKREYIRKLCMLEDIIADQGPRSFNRAMAFKAIKNKYSIEYKCIKQELREGKITTKKNLRSSLEN